jgi:general nucleoside transport system ATP-binding protein
MKTREGVVAGLAGVSKSFGSLRAVDDLWFDAAAGEVHALFGENGAGKTTAMKILAGLLRPDEGHVTLRGRPVRFRSRKEAARAGIGFVQQHFSLVEELTCAENLLLGQPGGGSFVDRRAAGRTLLDLSRRFRLEVEPETPVGELSMGERQRLEILIALSWGASVLILDEPTAALGVAEFAALREIVSSLKAEGVGVIFISHKLPEILELADRVTVMRSGRLVWNGPLEGTDPDALVVAMVGELPSRLPAEESPTEQAEPPEPVLRLLGVSRRGGPGVHPLFEIDLEVHPSEVLGVAGVAGNGQRELALILAGVDPPDAGRAKPEGVRAAYIPEDRARDGLAPTLSVSRNAIVRAHRRMAAPPLRWLSPSSVRGFTRRILGAFAVRPADPQAPTTILSGGNQQKLVLGRELDEGPQLIVAHNPARGLDVRTALEVRNRLLEARRRGAAVVLITPDLEELLDLSDRVVVLYQGRIVGTLSRDEVSAGRLGRLMAGMG